MTLARLELDHGFWEKLLDTSADQQTELACFRSDGNLNGLSSLSALAPYLSESELERFRETIKLGFLHVAKEIIPDQFWEEQLAKFYIRILTPDEAESIVLLYPDRTGTAADATLQQLRTAYAREILPELVSQIRTMEQTFRIPSGGMAPSLVTGDHIIVNKLVYREHSPSRGDVIAFRFPEDESKIFVKRIIGLPKDKLEIRDKIVYLNDQALQEDDHIQHTDPKIIEKTMSPRDNFGPVTVPENAYFVLGDSREASLDSRFWGYVNGDQIIGKVSIIYWSWDETAKTVRWERAGKRIH